ncbi:hypothetical protein X772_06875 [Mesorhizobium sp. LSJC280B00]|nr:hypothetical protein X772_06875 [Mesorhizobium sp. LSJC280B00]
MPWFEIIPRKVRHRPEPEGEKTPPPFPTLSTFLAIAAALIMIWLLAYGPPHLRSAHDRPVNNIDTGATK